MRLGFVGLGHMGVPMTARLTAAGHEVRGFDVDPAARARASARRRARRVYAARARATAPTVESLAEAAAGAEAVVLMLASSAVVRQVVLEDGLLDAVEPGIHPIHSDRMFGELHTNIGDRPLLATNALCQFVEPRLDAVEPPVDQRDLSPEEIENVRFDCHWESL